MMYNKIIPKAIGYTVLTEIALTGSAVVSFFIVGWYAILLYTITHPALVVLFLVDGAEDKSLCDTLSKHLVALTLVNVLIIFIFWVRRLNSRERASRMQRFANH